MMPVSLKDPAHERMFSGRLGVPGRGGAGDGRAVRRAASEQTSAAVRPAFRGTRLRRASRSIRTCRPRGTRRPASKCAGRFVCRVWRIRAPSSGATAWSSRRPSAVRAIPRSSPGSTAMARRPRTAPAISASCWPTIGGLASRCGNGWPTRGRRSTSVTSSPPMRAPRRRPTDGRVIVASFGSQGVFTYDVQGKLLWKRDLGRMDVGAYNLPVLRMGAGELADHLAGPRLRASRHVGRGLHHGARPRRRGSRCGRHRVRSCRHGRRRRSSKSSGPRRAGHQRARTSSAATTR